MEGGTPRHVLGTDQVGRDLLSRVIYGGRISLVIGVTAVLISTTIGVLLGLAGGYFGGGPDWTIMTAGEGVVPLPLLVPALPRGGGGHPFPPESERKQPYTPH